jgi:O-antigen/teichoic acid export membrane protein
MHAQVGHAGLWVAIRQLAVRGLTILQLLLLARILSPDDFGLFAVAMMVYAFIEAMTFLGFGHALIQRKTVEPIHLNTLFVVNIVRGALLGMIVFAMAEPVSWLMNSTESKQLIAAIGLLPLIMGLHNPAMILFQKELQMKQELVFHLAGAIANLCTSMALALQGYGAWALIAGLVSQALVQLVVSYLIQSYRPSLQFSRTTFSEMFQFGKWLLASQGLKYFSNNLPSWVIGHYIGVQSLGLYHVAGRFSQSIGNEFSALISTVAFPAFAKLQVNEEKLAMAYLRSQKIALSASFLIFSCIITLSTPFVYIFLGDKWHGAETLIALLAVVGMVQSIGAQAEILKALNLPKIIAKFSLIRLLIVIALIFFTTHRWGANGAVVAILVPTLITLVPSMSIILRKLNIGTFAFIRMATPSLISFALVSTIPFVTNLNKLSTFYQFALMTGICLITYTFSLIIIDTILKTGITSEWKLLAFKSTRIKYGKTTHL